MRHILAAAALAVSAAGVPAAAQAPAGACEQLKGLLSSSKDVVAGWRGEQKPTNNVTNHEVHASKLMLEGMTSCEVQTRTNGTNRYLQRHLSCEHEFASIDAAAMYLADMYACTGDVLGERSISDVWLEDRYMLEEIDGSVTTAGRDTPLRFGTHDYVRIWMRRPYPNSPEVKALVYFHHLE